MRIIEMRPELTAFDAGQYKQASSWHFHDSVETDDMGIMFDCRKIWHYDVLMMEFHGFFNGFNDETDEKDRVWTARVLSKGIGSATDQQGLNQLCGVRYYRDKYGDGMMLPSFHFIMLRDKKGGGPRVIYTGHPAGDHEVL